MIPVIFAALLCCASIWLISRRSKTFPPGPVGFPILGHIPLLGNEPHKTLVKWSKTYGPVIGLSLGSYRAIVIHDLKMIREAMNLNELSARPEVLSYIARGLTPCHGKGLSERRNFFLKNMRSFGVGTKSIETKISDEVLLLLKDLEATVGQPRQLKYAFSIAMLNTLSSIMLSETFDSTDPKINDILQRAKLVLDELNSITALTLLFPWLNHILPEKLTSKYVLTHFRDNVEGFIQEKINKHRLNYVPNQPRDIADVYEDKLRDTTEPNSKSQNQDIALHILSEMFLGGLDTTSLSLQSMCMYLINYPDVQRKMQEEIDKVIGHDRSPSLADRPTMNYTEAVIHEVLRHSSMFSLIPRRAVEDVEFHGYVIPKDTVVMANYYGCNFDNHVWEHPENFCPEHFLDSEGKFSKKHIVSSFGSGKRACPGESLARDNLFLFTVNLFQRFTFQSAGNSLGIEPITSGVILAPPQFEVILKERNVDH